MRILYLVDEDISTNSGVAQKIKSKIDLWEAKGNNVKLISLRSKSWNCVIPNSKILSVPTNGKINKLLHFATISKSLLHEINEFNPDVIYLRYIIYRPFLVKTLKAKCPYVVELNTIDVEEFKNSNLVAYYYNLLTRNLLLKNASGFISVTNEILHHPSFKKFRKPGLTLGNGINTSKLVEFIRDENSVSNEINIVFIGTPNQSWHGVDKLLSLATHCPQYKFHIIGPSLQDIEKFKEYKDQKNLLVYGYLNEVESKKIIKNCQIGVSSLALHRNRMEEACPLKSRQYLAQGLPIIIAYKDPDISNEPFTLNINNYENNVQDNIELIKEFVSTSVNISPKLIAKFAQERLDFTNKENTRLTFLDEIRS